MSRRPARTIVPTAKLTADNAGELELTSHCRAIASAFSASTASRLDYRPATSPITSSPLPESSPPPLTATENSSSLGSSPVRGSSKRPSCPTRSTLSHDSIITISTSTSDDADTDIDALDTAHRLKKAKAVPSGDQEDHTDTSIIDIDNIDDPNDEPLNKSDPTADLKYFFTLAPRLPGQSKTRMKCYLCS
jgi:hypothetical protein